MCFSVQIDKNIKNLAKRFHSGVDIGAFHQLKDMRTYASSLETEKLKSIMGLKRKPKTELFKTPEDDGRVYPGYFAPVITASDKGRTILPMRYRVRPNGSDEEIPTRYNVFNARVDSLEKRQTWSSLFMSNHGIFPFIRFFEWVEHKGRKELVNFSPDEYEVMWAPCLWDFWKSCDENIYFHSFALITDEPPKEIEERGHDRCPIFLKEDHIDSWLNPKGKSKEEVYSLLRNIHDVHYSYEWVS